MVRFIPSQLAPKLQPEFNPGDTCCSLNISPEERGDACRSLDPDSPLRQMLHAGVTTVPVGLLLESLPGFAPTLYRHQTLAVHVITSSIRALLAAGHLRAYQGDAVTQAFLAPMQRSKIVMPCGAGKTRVAAGIAAVGMAAMGMQTWLYVVGNRGLADQTAASMRSVLPSMLDLVADVAGVDANGFSSADIHCCSYGDARTGPRTWDGLIVDECHQAAARTRMAALLRLSVDGMRVGLTATDGLRTDKSDWKVTGVLGPVVHRVARKQLEDEGYLTPVKVVRGA